jgi:hypothetical protein
MADASAAGRRLVEVGLRELHFGIAEKRALKRAVQLFKEAMVCSTAGLKATTIPSSFLLVLRSTTATWTAKHCTRGVCWRASAPSSVRFLRLKVLVCDVVCSRRARSQRCKRQTRVSVGFGSRGAGVRVFSTGPQVVQRLRAHSVSGVLSPNTKLFPKPTFF